MKDWNIIVTIYQESFRRALRALQDIGPAERGPYHNVLVMKVGPDVLRFKRFLLANEQSFIIPGSLVSADST